MLLNWENSAYICFSKQLSLYCHMIRIPLYLDFKRWKIVWESLLSIKDWSEKAFNYSGFNWSSGEKEWETISMFVHMLIEKLHLHMWAYICHINCQFCSIIYVQSDEWMGEWVCAWLWLWDWQEVGHVDFRGKRWHYFGESETVWTCKCVR